MSVGNPVFEVVIPAFNAENTVTESVKSAIHAGATRVIVVDDGSEDMTSSVAQTAGAQVIRQMNAGASVARRTGLREVEAPYVVMLDADDALITEGVKQSITDLESNPSTVACGGSALGFFQSGETVTVAANVIAIDTRQLLMQGFSPTPPACVVWRTAELRHALLDSAPAPLLPRYAEDYEMIIRASLHGEIRFHRELAARYAMEGGKSIVDPSNSIESAAKIRDYYSDALGISVPRWSERSVKARIELRRYKNSHSRSQRVLHLARSFVNSPGLFFGILSGKLNRDRLLSRH